MTLDEIRELIQLVTETGVAELEVQRGENRVWIRRAAATNHAEIVLPAHSSTVAAPASPPPAVAPEPPAPGEKEAEKAILVKSPIVGTFYEAHSPGAAPFVRIGEPVQPGKVLCIIESMKLMNEIEAEFCCKIVKICKENAQPVEFGDVLFIVEPL